MKPRVLPPLKPDLRYLQRRRSSAGDQQLLPKSYRVSKEQLLAPVSARPAVRLPSTTKPKSPFASTTSHITSSSSSSSSSYSSSRHKSAPRKTTAGSSLHAAQQRIKTDLAKAIRQGQFSYLGEEADEVVEVLSNMYTFSFGNQDDAFTDYSIGNVKQDVKMYSRAFNIEQDCIQDELVLHYKAIKTKQTVAATINKILK